MIAHLITNFEKRGGAEGLLIRHLISMHDDSVVVISLMKISEDISRQLPKTVKLVQLNSKNALTMFLSSIKLMKILRDNNVKDLVCWMYHANIIGSISCIFNRTVNIIWNVRHSLDDHAGESFSTKIAIGFGRLVSWRANKVIFCAMKSLDQHILINYCNAEKAIYIPNGFLFENINPNKRIFSNNKKIIFGSAGRFHPSKDYETLFRGIKILQDSGYSFELRLAGLNMTSSNKDLLSLISKIGLYPDNIVFFGFMENMNQFYSEIDIFILSSKTEGFPNVLVEAVCCGCLCVASDAGNSSRILSDTNRIFAIKNYEELANIITYYLSFEQNDIDVVIKKDLRHVVEQFSINKFNDRLTNLYS